MKPKTKLQKQVDALRTKLPEITEKQRQWAIDHCFEHRGYLRKNTVWCTECGHTWQPSEGHLILVLTDLCCPHCGTKLKVTSSRKQKENINEYYTVITTSRGFQVLRHYVARKFCKVGRPATFEVNEAVQNWISPEGKEVLVYRSTKMSFFCIDLWDWNSPMEIRSPSHNRQKYDIYANFIYPGRRYIHNITRNGFKGYFHGITPLTIFTLLLSNSKAETLLKAKQYDMLRFLGQRGTVSCWPSIRICLRNGYIIKDASMWTDYINMLRTLGMDILNARYVCPTNLREAHDRIEKKVRVLQAKKRLEEQRREAAEYEKKYQKLKAKFFDVEFSDNLIQISVLRSVREFLEEGTAMHHCVYSAKYFLKDDSLILSARVGDERIETIEISLKKMEIVQSRGVCNKNTIYHDRIIALVRKNMNLIRRTMTA